MHLATSILTTKSSVDTKTPGSALTSLQFEGYDNSRLTARLRHPWIGRSQIFSNEADQAFSRRRRDKFRYSSSFFFFGFLSFLHI